jgi:hypothetical protein
MPNCGGDIVDGLCRRLAMDGHELGLGQLERQRASSNLHKNSRQRAT